MPLLLGLLALIGPLRAQESFKDQFHRFYQNMESAPSYQMEATVTVFDHEKQVSKIPYQVKKKGPAYFIKMNGTERIFNEDMVITMDPEFKSVMVTERQGEDGFSLFSSEEYFLALDSLTREGFIRPLPSDGDDQKYEMKLPSGPYSRLVLTFKKGLLAQVVSHYSDPESPFTHSILDLDFNMEAAPSKSFFTLDRYVQVNHGGEYQFREKYKDFELSLN